MAEYRDLFKGTAWHYARYRPGYPEVLFRYVRDTFHLDGTGRLLDLGCGTGHLALALAKDFEEVVGLDPEPEMLAEAAAGAKQLGITKGISWIEGSSGDLERLRPRLGRFRLVTIGRAFHWMNRDAALQSLSPMVQLGGGIVITGDGSFYTGTSDWQFAVQTVISRWLGEQRRAGSATYVEPSEPHETVIGRSPFKLLEIRSYHFQRPWTIETILGNLYSTSFCSLILLGDKRKPFEQDLRQTLLAIEPSGEFTENASLEIIAAQKIGFTDSSSRS